MFYPMSMFGDRPPETNGVRGAVSFVVVAALAGVALGIPSGAASRQDALYPFLQVWGADCFDSTKPIDSTRLYPTAPDAQTEDAIGVAEQGTEDKGVNFIVAAACGQVVREGSVAAGDAVDMQVALLQPAATPRTYSWVVTRFVVQSPDGSAPAHTPDVVVLADIQE